MTGAPDTATAAPSNPQAKRGRLVAVGLVLAMVALVPFVVTGLFRLGLPDLMVLLVCVLAGAALLAVPRRGRQLALGWALGCALWAAALFAVLVQVGQDLDRIG